ncbi:MAG: PrsW family glutamic-type intramembrane protease [Planctomycetota bacterium]
MSGGADPPAGDNPFASSDSADAPQPTPRGRIGTDPSVDFEPHLSGQELKADPSEESAASRIAPDADLSPAEQAEHSVWDEPALGGELAGEAPADQVTYGRWLDEQIARTTAGDSWRTTFRLAAAAGPWGLIGAAWTLFVGGGYGMSSLLATAVFSPVTEEIVKVAAVLWVVEKRPFRFKSTGQILFCAAAGGLVFAAIESLLYLAFYGATTRAGLLILSTAMHVLCSTVSGVGLGRIWADSITRRRRPELAVGMPQFAAAIWLHGLYNATLWLADAAGFGF